MKNQGTVSTVFVCYVVQSGAARHPSGAFRADLLLHAAAASAERAKGDAAFFKCPYQRLYDLSAAGHEHSQAACFSDCDGEPFRYGGALFLSFYTKTSPNFWKPAPKIAIEGEKSL